jgi:membrane-associated phospholipid phosphatase
LALLLATALTFAIRSNEFLPFEKAISDWMAVNSDWAGESLAEALDLISDDDVAPFVFIGALFVTWAMVGRYQAIFVGFAGLIAAATKLSDLADRPRPATDGGWTNAVTGDGGFRSRHVIYAVLIFGFLAVYSWRHISNPLLRFTPAASSH